MTKTFRSRATRLTLLCRGATPSNRLPRLFSDEPLLPKDAKRATALAKALPAFDRVLHAPETSASETAAAFSSAAEPCPALRDADYGRWSGRTIDDIAAEAPHALESWMSDPTAAPHGGESAEAVLARAAAFLDGLHGEGGPLLAVTHGLILKVLLLHVLGAPLTSLRRVDVAPLGTLALSSDGRRWVLRGFATEPPAMADLS